MICHHAVGQDSISLGQWMMTWTHNDLTSLFSPWVPYARPSLFSKFYSINVYIIFRLSALFLLIYFYLYFVILNSLNFSVYVYIIKKFLNKSSTSILPDVHLKSSPSENFKSGHRGIFLFWLVITQVKKNHAICCQ